MRIHDIINEENWVPHPNAVGVYIDIDSPEFKQFAEPPEKKLAQKDTMVPHPTQSGIYIDSEHETVKEPSDNKASISQKDTMVPHPTQTGVFIDLDSFANKGFAIKKDSDKEKIIKRNKAKIPKPVTTKVRSSWISDLSFDPEESDITVRTNTGRSFDIDGANPDEYNGWLSAKSKGKYFHSNIKPRHPR